MEKQLRIDFKKIIDSSNFSEKEIITKEKYLNKFIQNGFPGKKNEDWKFLDINQAIKSNIENTIIYNLYGQAYQNLALYEKSITKFKKAIELQENNYFAINNLAMDS